MFWAQRLEELIVKIIPATTLNDLDCTDVTTLFSYIAFLAYQYKRDTAQYIILDGKKYKKTTADRMATYAR